MREEATMVTFAEALIRTEKYRGKCTEMLNRKENLSLQLNFNG
jgi:hypothetical protein